MEEGPSRSRVRFTAGTIANNVDILNEIFRHLDAKSLARAACVSKKWKQATDEEALWEAICTRHWPANATSASAQLKTVVVALGGFKRLYVNCLQPLLSRSGGRGAPAAYKRSLLSRPLSNKWSKDEVYLSLSLFSIDCYERIAPPSAEHRHPAAEVRRLLDGWRGKCTADQLSKVDIDNNNDDNSP